MSDHAARRTRQRGIKKNFVEFVLDEADAYEYVEAHTEALSAKELKRLITDEVLTPSEAGRVQNIVVVERDDTILTVYHKTKNSAGIKVTTIWEGVNAWLYRCGANLCFICKTRIADGAPVIGVHLSIKEKLPCLTLIKLWECLLDLLLETPSRILNSSSQKS